MELEFPLLMFHVEAITEDFLNPTLNMNKRQNFEKKATCGWQNSAARWEN